LVAEGDQNRLMDRHVIDSLRAAAVVDSADRSIVDLGSGAGLPGIPVALAHPTVQVSLAEPKRRRLAFLEFAVDSLALRNATVLATRAEDLAGGPDRWNLCLARALAPLPRAWDLARPLLRPGGRLAYFSGPLGAAPPVPPGAARVELSRKILVDSPGPLVILTRQ
jgi:16S rRNA (guanine527-N7)-methyltransferase